MTPAEKFDAFVAAATRVVETRPQTAQADIRPLLARLVARDDWLPEEFAQADALRYRQYLLHLDPLRRFSVVSFVWGPGQATPIHDHRVWALVGALRGAEIETPYLRPPGGALVAGAPRRLEPGTVVALDPGAGDVHAVRNAFDDRVSISVHVYGGDIGAIRRAVFDAQDGGEKPFVSGYSNAPALDVSGKEFAR